VSLFALSNDGDNSYMTVLGNGWAAAKATTGSSYIALGRIARETLLPALTLKLGDITVGETRKESTKNIVPSGIFIAMCINVVTLTLRLPCDNQVKAISLAPLLCLSGVVSKYCDK
jgi:hypothetical protein